MLIFVVVMFMKDEVFYIIEWVVYYCVFGFDCIVVFVNDCSDGMYEMLVCL